MTLELLVSALVAFASAQTQGGVVAVPVLPAPVVTGSLSTGVHPLLVNDWASPGHPLLPQLTLHAAELAKVGPAKLLPALAAGTPAERLSAGVLSRALAEPAAARRLIDAQPALAASLGASGASEDPAVVQLSKLAAMDPAVSAVFDGGRGGLELEGVSVKGSRLVLGDRKLQRLGHGDFGMVDVHPRVDGAVVKTADHSFETMIFTTIKPKDSVDEDEATSKALAAAGAGPRYLGRTVLSGRPASVKERVYGQTVADLIYDRKFGEEEYRLMQDLLDRLAAGRLMVQDMRLVNIMIGTTRLDPVRRAYQVDGGEMLAVDPAWSADELRERLRFQPVIIKAMPIGPGGDPLIITKPMDELLLAGVRRTSRNRWWQILGDALKEMYLSPQLPPLNKL